MFINRNVWWKGRREIECISLCEWIDGQSPHSYTFLIRQWFRLFNCHLHFLCLPCFLFQSTRICLAHFVWSYFEVYSIQQSLSPFFTFLSSTPLSGHSFTFFQMQWCDIFVRLCYLLHSGVIFCVVVWYLCACMLHVFFSCMDHGPLSGHYLGLCLLSSPYVPTLLNRSGVPKQAAGLLQG